MSLIINGTETFTFSTEQNNNHAYQFTQCCGCWLFWTGFTAEPTIQGSSSNGHFSLRGNKVDLGFLASRRNSISAFSYNVYVKHNSTDVEAKNQKTNKL